MIYHTSTDEQDFTFIPITYKTFHEDRWPVWKESFAPLIDLPSQHLNQMKCELSRKTWVSIFCLREFFLLSGINEDLIMFLPDISKDLIILFPDLYLIGNIFKGYHCLRQWHFC